MKIKSNSKLFFCGLLSFILLLSGMNLNIYAQENTLSSNTTDITMEEGYSVLASQRNTPYYVDQNGKILDTAPMGEPYVEVLYDSRWDTKTNSELTTRAGTTAYQYININGIVLKGSSGGHYSVSWYNTTINVGMYVYFNTSTLNITSVKDATVLYTNCPLISSHSNAWVSASASGGRAHAKGYITYYEPYRETLTGSGSWGFK